MTVRGTLGIVTPIKNLRDRIKEGESNERAELSAAIPALLFANLPVAGQAGRLRFVTDGRKVGEGAGLGTGVPAYDDGVAFRRCSDDSTVAV